MCLPVLFRLWRGKGTASPVQLARELISILAQAFPDRFVHAVGDAAYHGKALLVPATTITTRLPANAALYALAPPRTGKRGRPRSKGARLGRPVDLAATAQWRRATITRYGRSVIVEIADIPSIWYGAFGNTPGRAVLVRDPGDDRVLAVFTTDTDSCTDAVVERYAHRWPIETAIASGKQLLGIGQARNRLQRAVERTVPLSFCVYSIVIVWYTLHGSTPTTSPAAAATSLGTPTRTNPPSKTCSPSSAEHLSPHQLQALPQLNPTPTNTATTNWPAPLPPHNCETQVIKFSGVSRTTPSCASTAMSGQTARPPGPASPLPHSTTG